MTGVTHDHCQHILDSNILPKLTVMGNAPKIQNSNSGSNGSCHSSVTVTYH